MEKLEDKICLDTDFLINFLRSKKEETEFIKNNENKHLATTFINLFELYYGAYRSKFKSQNMKSISLLIERVEILNFSLESSRKAGELMADLEKNGNMIDFRDLLIGTIAFSNGYSVKTSNKKHFEKIEGLKVL